MSWLAEQLWTSQAEIAARNRLLFFIKKPHYVYYGSLNYHFALFLRAYEIAFRY
jgi:hypothetical protein